MDFGDAGHILVSKTLADTLLQLSDWGKYLTDLGTHAVKHRYRCKSTISIPVKLEIPASPAS